MMAEDLEECVRRIEVAEARLEEQVKGFQSALIQVQALVSGFFDRMGDTENTLKEIQTYGCHAGELSKARSKGEMLERRLQVVEGKPAHHSAVRFWVILGALGGVIVGSALDSAVGPVLAKLLEQFVK